MGEECAQSRKDVALLLAAGGNHRLQAGIYFHSLLMRCQTTEQIAPRRAFWPSFALLGASGGEAATEDYVEIVTRR